MLDWHLLYAPLGLLPFISPKYPLPTSPEISAILETEGQGVPDYGCRISGGEFVPEAERFLISASPYLDPVDEYGGIDLFHDIFNEWARVYPKEHRLLRLWSTKGTCAARTVADVSEYGGYCETSSLYKMRRRYLKQVAYDVYIRYLVIGEQVAVC